MNANEARKYLIDISYALGNMSIEYLTEKDGAKMREAIETLCQEKESCKDEGGWIPVSERLPEKNVEVLATTQWGAVTIAEMYSANDWFIHEGTTNAEIDEIVAWMPLPQPYKAESEKE